MHWAKNITRGPTACIPTPIICISPSFALEIPRPVVLRSPILKCKITPQSAMQIELEKKSSLDDIINFWTNLVTIQHLWHFVVFYSTWLICTYTNTHYIHTQYHNKNQNSKRLTNSVLQAAVQWRESCSWRRASGKVRTRESKNIKVPNSPTSLFKMGANSSEVGPLVIEYLTQWCTCVNNVQHLVQTATHVFICQTMKCKNFWTLMKVNTFTVQWQYWLIMTLSMKLLVSNINLNFQWIRNSIYKLVITQNAAENAIMLNGCNCNLIKVQYTTLNPQRLQSLGCD